MHHLIDVLEDFPPEAFLDEYFGRKPVVIRGKMAHWPASRKWSPEYLRKTYGNEIVITSRYDPKHCDGFLDQTLQDVHRKLPLRNFLIDLESNDGRFAIREDTSLLRRVPQLLDELDHFFPFAAKGSPDEGRYKALWIGPARYVTGLHLDPGDTLLFQIYGRKELLLFGPDQTPYLYEEGEERSQRFAAAPLRRRLDSSEFEVLQNQVRWCRADPFAPSFQRHPLLMLAEHTEATICPGDALYIPDQWWHTVRSLDHSISVSMEPRLDGPLFVKGLL